MSYTLATSMNSPALLSYTRPDSDFFRSTFSVCSNESSNCPSQLYRAVTVMLALSVGPSFRFSDSVPEVDNDPYIDPQQCRAPLDRDIHVMDMATTTLQRFRFPGVAWRMHRVYYRVSPVAVSSSANDGIMRSTINSSQPLACICQICRQGNLQIKKLAHQI